MTGGHDQPRKSSSSNAETLQTLAELLALLGLLIVMYAATIPLAQWIVVWGQQFAPSDLSAIQIALNITGYSQSPVSQVFISALRTWGVGLIYLALSYAIGSLLGGTGKVLRSMRLLSRGFMLSVAVLILLGPLVGTLFALKVGACSRSLTYGGEEAFCPLGPPGGLIFLFTAVGVLTAFGVMSYAISRAHHFALWRGIATFAGGVIVILVLQSIIATTIGFGR